MQIDATHWQTYGEQISRLLDWNKGRARGPIHIEFYPTNRCNIQCRICWQRQDNYDKTYATEMSDERCLRLVDEAAELGVDWWTIKGGGEPMARGKLVMEMIRRIRSHGMNGLLQSNATLLKPAQIEELVALGWHRVVVSLDGPTEEINDEIRSAGFAKACANMKLLSEAKARAGASLPQLEMNTVVTNRIVDRLDEVFHLAHAHGVERVYFSGLIRFTENCDPFLVDEASMARLRAHIAEASALAASLSIAHNLAELLDPAVWSSPNDRDFGAEYPRPMGVPQSLCFKAYTELVVHPNGFAGPCCMSYDERSDSLQDKSLREVWEEGYMRRVRGHFEENRPMSYCAQCPTSLYRDNVIQRAMLAEAHPPIGRRFQRAVSKGVDGLRTNGVGWTLRHGAQWVRNTWRIYR
jgi:MoaA/NifB/PqqE/SkfB family radical SAM enzyme